NLVGHGQDAGSRRLAPVLDLPLQWNGGVADVAFKRRLNKDVTRVTHHCMNIPRHGTRWMNSILVARSDSVLPEPIGVRLSIIRHPLEEIIQSSREMCPADAALLASRHGEHWQLPPSQLTK